MRERTKRTRFQRGATHRAGSSVKMRIRTSPMGHPGGKAAGCMASWKRLRGLPPVRLVRALAATHPSTPPALCAVDMPDVSGGKRGQDRACMGCSLNDAMQGPVMHHHMCADEGLPYGAAWCHGTAQRLTENTSRAARARHEVTIESLTYKFINEMLPRALPCDIRDRSLSKPHIHDHAESRADGFCIE